MTAGLAAGRRPTGISEPPPRRDTVVFDLGGVLIDWNPRHLYRKLFDADVAAMEAFLADICNGEWNAAQDAGRPFAEAVALLVEAHPGKEALIRAYHERWDEMLAGPIAGTVAILEELHRAGTPLYALTNWSAETFPVARRRFGFLRLFRGILVSGEQGLIKPDPRIFWLLLERFGLSAAELIYIDDAKANVAVAAELGMHAIAFETPEQLGAALAAAGLPLVAGR